MIELQIRLVVQTQQCFLMIKEALLSTHFGFIALQFNLRPMTAKSNKILSYKDYKYTVSHVCDCGKSKYSQAPHSLSIRYRALTLIKIHKT